jgi:succinylarginine dihydrolase
MFVQQHPLAIDQGVFHNDVIATGNQNVLLYHELAFVETGAVIAELRRRYRRINQQEPYLYEVANRRCSVPHVVQTYLFNCQIVTLPGGDMILLAPQECRASPAAIDILNELEGDPICPIKAITYVDLTQSMLNGGGPACLRLRVVLTTDEVSHMLQSVLLTPALYTTLRAWIEKHYRENLSLDDLADPLLLRESRTALDELTQFLKLGAIYPFQQ